MRRLRSGSRLDKYRIIELLGHGGFSTVYSAFDTLEGRRVALKLPHEIYWSDPDSRESLLREVRMNVRLDHPNILPLKSANELEGRLILVFPLGEETLSARLGRRMARSTAVELAHQMAAAVAHAHENRILHCDIKPENFILFSGPTVRLTDFGLARVARPSMFASGSGTVGYMAPEQAMGRPTYRSDVFSLGLVLYRMFSGRLPHWPFQSPLPGDRRLRRFLHPDLVALLRKAIDPTPKRRFRDAVAMRNALARIRQPLL